MKILRSILGVVVGLIVAVVAVFIVEAIGHSMFPSEGIDRNDREAFKKLMADPEAMRKYLDELPAGALVAVFVAWQTGAFFGGATAALVAGRGRCVHAGIIGAFVLLISLLPMMTMPHPVWLKIGGLLAPLPVSLIAGKIVSLLFPPPPPVTQPSMEQV